MHSVWRAGFDECHGSDICDGSNNWANVQTDAEMSRVYLTGIETVTMLSLLGIMVLIEKKHTAGLSISWKALLLVQVLTLVGEIPTLVPQYPSAIAAAQTLRATGNEVSGLLPRNTAHLLLLRLYRTRFRDTVLRDGCERQALRQQPGGAEGSRYRRLDRRTGLGSEIL